MNVSQLEDACKPLMLNINPKLTWVNPSCYMQQLKEPLELLRLVQSYLDSGGVSCCCWLVYATSLKVVQMVVDVEARK